MRELINESTRRELITNGGKIVVGLSALSYLGLEPLPTSAAEPVQVPEVSDSFAYFIQATPDLASFNEVSENTCYYRVKFSSVNSTLPQLKDITGSVLKHMLDSLSRDIKNRTNIDSDTDWYVSLMPPNKNSVLFVSGGQVIDVYDIMRAYQEEALDAWWENK